MNSILPICLLLIAGKMIPFDVHDGYFVSNKFELDVVTSIVAIKSHEEFNSVFGSAFVTNDKSHRLPSEAFRSKMVVAVIHRGNSVWNYKVKSVEADGKKLIVRYTTMVTPQSSASFSCPLVVSVPKSDYSVVQFVEDGQTIKTLKF